MTYKRLYIRFKEEWVRNEHGGNSPPVNRFAQAFSNAPWVTVEGVAHTYCVVLWKKRTANEKIVANIYETAVQTFSLEDPSGVIEVEIEKLEADAEGNVPSPSYPETGGSILPVESSAPPAEGEEGAPAAPSGEEAPAEPPAGETPAPPEPHPSGRQTPSASELLEQLQQQLSSTGVPPRRMPPVPPVPPVPSTPPTGEETEEEHTMSESHPSELGRMSLLLQNVLGTREELSRSVKGQMHAVEAFTAGLFAMQIHAGSEHRKNKPRAVFLFAGPPGVGKTFLAESAAKQLNLPFLRLDMSGFTDDSAAVEAFRGINPSYKAASAGLVTSFVEEHPDCVLLFDEIEKAHTNVIQLFLQILEGARCRDAFTEQNVSFEDAIIIMTTNAGKSLYEDTDKRNFSDVSDRMVIDALKNDVDQHGNPVFPRAILSRLAEGTVIMFNHLEPLDLCHIVDGEMERLLDSYRSDFGLKVTLDPTISTVVLYSQGGDADARTLKGAAKALIDEEMLALLQRTDVEKLKEIEFTIDLDGSAPEARALFLHTKRPRVLMFGEPGETVAEGDYELIFTQNLEEAQSLLRGDVDCVLIDVSCGAREMSFTPCDPEDIVSDGVDFFRYAREYYDEIPVYIIDTGKFAADGYSSFIRAGARGTVSIETREGFLEECGAVCRNVLMCQEANALARGHKALFYNCAQIPSEDGSHAEIRVTSMCIKRNVSSEDQADVLSESGKPQVRFSDIIGAKDAKETLADFIEFFKDPRKFLAKGVRAPRGVLLYGAPGTGKTMLARALAGESDVTFIQKNATEFFKRYVGEGPKAIRDIFRLARKYAPSVLFIDEIDTIGKLRTGSDTMHAMEELQNTFLSEMDGFTYDEKRPVFVLAATNYTIDGEEGGRTLDPAFVRRFDRKIEIELPNTEERAQFISFYLNRHGITNIPREVIENLALRSIGRSPADLELVIELAIRSMKGEPLTPRALDQALDHDRFGKEKEWSPATVERTSYHEAGHTAVSWYTGSKPTYVTNISRGSYGGYMLPEVDDKKFGYTRQEMLDRICCSLGGRAAEIVVYGTENGITTGASSDLASATNTAWRLICTYGMDGETLVTKSKEELSGEEGVLIRRRINEILNEQLQRAIRILREHRSSLEALKGELVRRNSLTGKEIAEIIESRG